MLHDFKTAIPGGVTIVPGRTGAFEVNWNGELIYSKFATDRFPEALEVESVVAHKLGLPPPVDAEAAVTGGEGI